MVPKVPNRSYLEAALVSIQTKNFIELVDECLTSKGFEKKKTKIGSFFFGVVVGSPNHSYLEAALVGLGAFPGGSVRFARVGLGHSPTN